MQWLKKQAVFHILLDQFKKSCNTEIMDNLLKRINYRNF